MEKAFGQASPELARYAEEVFEPEDRALREIRERARAAGMPEIQVGRFDALHLEVLTRAAGAERAVEIGTLAGYSGLAILRGLAPGGRLYTFEVSRDHLTVAEESFKRHGFGDRVRTFVGPAIERLPEIEPEGPFDLVFIDADKDSYPRYLGWAEEHLRIGGLVIGDNTFGFGRVGHADSSDTGVKAIEEFNRRVAKGGRFRGTILPTEEGLTVGVKIR